MLVGIGMVGSGKSNALYIQKNLDATLGQLLSLSKLHFPHL